MTLMRLQIGGKGIVCALELEQGWSQRAIAKALAVTEGAVSQWMKRARTEGVQGLHRRLAPRPTPKLNAEQRT